MFEQLYLVGVYQLRRWTLGVWQFRPSLTYTSLIEVNTFPGPLPLGGWCGWRLWRQSTSVTDCSALIDSPRSTLPRPNLLQSVWLLGEICHYHYLLSEHDIINALTTLHPSHDCS